MESFLDQLSAITQPGELTALGIVVLGLLLLDKGSRRATLLGISFAIMFSSVFLGVGVALAGELAPPVIITIVPVEISPEVVDAVVACMERYSRQGEGDLAQACMWGAIEAGRESHLE